VAVFLVNGGLTEIFGILWTEAYPGLIHVRPVLLAPPFYDIFFINDSTGWAVGGEGMVKYTNDNGYTWQTQNPQNQSTLTAVKFTDINNGWIVGVDSVNNNDFGVLLHSNDGGFTWEQQLGDTIPLLNDIAFADSLNGWAVGDSGTIFHTIDGGITWEYQQSGTTANLNSICFVDYDNGWISGDSSIILHTDNGGIVGIEPDVQRSKFKVQCIPNPVSENCSIEFELPQSALVSIKIFGSMGRELAELENRWMPAGHQQIKWSAAGLPKGIYFCGVKIGNEIVTKKIIKTR